MFCKINKVISFLYEKQSSKCTTRKDKNIFDTPLETLKIFKKKITKNKRNPANNK